MDAVLNERLQVLLVLALELLDALGHIERVRARVHGLFFLFLVGRVLGLGSGDLGVGIDEAHDHVLHAALTGGDRLIGVEE